MRIFSRRIRDENRDPEEKAEAEARPSGQCVDLHCEQDQVEHPELRSLIRLIACVADGLSGARPGSVEEIIDHDEKAVTIEIIQKHVADYYNLKPPISSRAH